MENVKRNIFLLSMAQFVLLASVVTVITYSSLVGMMLTNDTALATIPSATAFLATASFAFPASMFMKRFGRKAGFAFGAVCGGLAGLFAVMSIYMESFALLCFATFVHGIYQAFANFYRFTAMEVSPISFHKQAVSYVILGGVLAGLSAPTLAGFFESNYFEPIQYAGTYCLIIALSIVAQFLIYNIKLPPRKKVADDHVPVSNPKLMDVLKRPAFICASLSATAAYGSMSFIMTATPLEVVEVCGYLVSDAAGVIQWHSMSMFAPAVITGTLIARYGSVKIILLGMIGMLVSTLAAKQGLELYNFYAALILIGMGWNFMFTAGTTLLEHAYNEEEKAYVQGLNDLVVFGLAGLATLSSGFMLDRVGWNVMNNIVIGILFTLLFVIIWFTKVRDSGPKDRKEAVI
ncbi:MFS transporter [Pseudemcibacter aquimaris]|uniref:MFS transporter n=1 Tax=Pseudemcibacter aquimaris TaxID=2857064 RepID=UPI0020121135|nr:MFS transporter [Pseudemcibacter aquimaris]MCC3860987.1 MFS transporter [Pseudemcibacter aquimaris]WDU59805.1 MFS transporter [Pseudemcibacter aquimaris]